VLLARVGWGQFDANDSWTVKFGITIDITNNVGEIYIELNED
jgi:hypothetical protein